MMDTSWRITSYELGNILKESHSRIKIDVQAANHNKGYDINHGERKYRDYKGHDREIYYVSMEIAVEVCLHYSKWIKPRAIFQLYRTAQETGYTGEYLVPEDLYWK